jgi:hypothetical protein
LKSTVVLVITSALFLAAGYWAYSEGVFDGGGDGLGAGGPVGETAQGQDGPVSSIPALAKMQGKPADEPLSGAAIEQVRQAMRRYVDGFVAASAALTASGDCADRGERAREALQATGRRFEKDLEALMDLDADQRGGGRAFGPAAAKALKQQRGRLRARLNVAVDRFRLYERQCPSQAVALKGTLNRILGRLKRFAGR